MTEEDQDRPARQRRQRRSVDIHVGRRIKERRCLLGLGRIDLAETLKLSIQQVQKYESGDSTVSASRLYEIGVALGVAPSYFFEDVAPPLPDQAGSLGPGQGMGEPNSQEVRQMVATYREINNPKLRHNLYELARAMAKAMGGDSGFSDYSQASLMMSEDEQESSDRA